MRKTSFTINDLPAFSPWPARLLGLEPWESKPKTKEEVVREFEHERWEPLLARLNKEKGNIKVEKVDEWYLQHNPPSLYSRKDRLEMLSPSRAHALSISLMAKKLKSCLPGSALVELGAGYGSVILSLAKQKAFSSMPIFAGEYMPSGVELIKRLALAQGQEIVAGHCDLKKSKLVDFSIPPGAILFTSMATMYLTHLPDSFIDALLAIRPKFVVHFEPCYEHCNTKTLLGALRRRYIEVNNYNRNLVALLHDQEKKGRIRIIDEQPAVIGLNPLCPVSFLVWKFR